MGVVSEDGQSSATMVEVRVVPSGGLSYLVELVALLSMFCFSLA